MSGFLPRVPAHALCLFLLHKFFLFDAWIWCRTSYIILILSLSKKSTFLMHWKLPFFVFICQERCRGARKERRTEWGREEKRREVTGSLLDDDDSQGWKGGGSTAALFSGRSFAVKFSFYRPSRSSFSTHAHKQNRCKYGGDVSEPMQVSRTSQIEACACYAQNVSTCD